MLRHAEKSQEFCFSFGVIQQRHHHHHHHTRLHLQHVRLAMRGWGGGSRVHSEIDTFEIVLSFLFELRLYKTKNTQATTRKEKRRKILLNIWIELMITIEVYTKEEESVGRIGVRYGDLSCVALHFQISFSLRLFVQWFFAHFKSVYSSPFFIPPKNGL